MKNLKRLFSNSSVQLGFLFVLALFVNLIFVKMANREGFLSGEEASVSIRDVFLFPHRLQHNKAASNWGGHLIYWLSYQLWGSLGLFYGRFTKAVLMAPIVPLFFYVQTHTLKISRTVAFLTACLVMLLPGIVNYTWMSTENGLEVTLGLLAITLAFSGLPWALAVSSGLAAFTALTYGAGMAFIPVVFYLLMQRRLSFASLHSFRALRNRLRDHRNWGFMLGMILIFLAVLGLPLLWWKNPCRILLGGGSIPSFYGGYLNLKQFLVECWIRGGSYYYYSKYPAFSSLLLLFPVLGGMWVTAKERKGAWIWLGFLASLVLYVLAGRESGMRRGIPIVLFLSFFLSLGFNHWFSGRWKTWKKSVVLGVLIFSISFASIQYFKVLKRFSGGGELWVDYQFAISKGKTQVEMSRILLEHPELLPAYHWDAKQGLILPDYEYDRTYPILYFIQQAEGLKPYLSRAEVLGKIKIERP